MKCFVWWLWGWLLWLPVVSADSETLAGRAFAVVGGGPAGLRAANLLVAQGATVLLFNQDEKLGGLISYGWQPSRVERIRDQTRECVGSLLSSPLIDLHSGVRVGQGGRLTYQRLRHWNLPILIATGNQEPRRLNVRHETNGRVHQAHEFYRWLTYHPDYEDRKFPLGPHVAIIGAGNVAYDFLHYRGRGSERGDELFRVERFTTIVRGGPESLKFTNWRPSLLAPRVVEEGGTPAESPDPPVEFIFQAKPVGFSPVGGDRVQVSLQDRDLRGFSRVYDAIIVPIGSETDDETLREGRMPGTYLLGWAKTPNSGHAGEVMARVAEDLDQLLTEILVDYPARSPEELAALREEVKRYLADPR